MTNWLILFFGFGICLFLIKPANAVEIGDSKWNVMGGYSFTHTNLGQTEVWVESVFLAGSYERVLTHEFGPSWLKGYHSVRFEVPVHYVFAPNSGIMTGINFIGLWSFTNLLTEYNPYLLAGGGPVYIDADIPGMSKDVNGTYMFGAGAEFDAGLSHNLKIEYRFSHVSNGGQKEPNVPLNSSNLMVGFAF
jgi:hypothetical protein